MVDAGTAAMLVNIGPLLIAGLAGVFLGEGFPRALIAGALVAFAGTAILAAATGMGEDASVAGVVLCLGAALAYAGGVVIQKPLLTSSSALQVTWLACTVGAIACLPFAPALVREMTVADASVLGWAVFLGVFPTAIAFTTWAYALRRTTAGRMGATTYLVRRWPSCWLGSCLVRYHRWERSPAVSCACSASRSPAGAPWLLRPY